MRVTIKTWPKPETAPEKSPAPRVGLTLIHYKRSHLPFSQKSLLQPRQVYFNSSNFKLCKERGKDQNQAEYIDELK